MNLLTLFKPIQTLIFDVDGVMTDGSLQLLPDGELVRTMNIKDGYALQLAVRSGLRIGVISGGISEGVVKRLNGLGISDIFTGTDDKRYCMQEYIQRHALQPEEILYMGDDIPDLEAMLMAGLPVCPADAMPEIRHISKYISPFGGGRGCVREVIEKVLKLKGKWPPGSRQVPSGWPGSNG